MTTRLIGYWLKLDKFRIIILPQVKGDFNLAKNNILSFQSNFPNENCEQLAEIWEKGAGEGGGGATTISSAVAIKLESMHSQINFPAGRLHGIKG